MEAPLRHINSRHLTVESVKCLVVSKIRRILQYFLQKNQGSNPVICCFNTEGRPHRTSLVTRLRYAEPIAGMKSSIILLVLTRRPRDIAAIACSYWQPKCSKPLNNLPQLCMRLWEYRTENWPKLLPKKDAIKLAITILENWPIWRAANVIPVKHRVDARQITKIAIMVQKYAIPKDWRNDAAARDHLPGRNFWKDEGAATSWHHVGTIRATSSLPTSRQYGTEYQSSGLKKALNWLHRAEKREPLIRPMEKKSNIGDIMHDSLQECTEKTIFPFPFILNEIWSWWQFSFRF